jgi:hypothetical protein
MRSEIRQAHARQQLLLPCCDAQLVPLGQGREQSRRGYSLSCKHGTEPRYRSLAIADT